MGRTAKYKGPGMVGSGSGGWAGRALCRTRPVDWWEWGDGGNRLALLLCQVCPVLVECGDPSLLGGDPLPTGVIRAGRAWDGMGVAVPLCPCGYPVGRPPMGPRRGDAGLCQGCRVPRVRLSRSRKPKLGAA